MKFLEQGTRTYVLEQMLGHKSIRTTAKYLHISNEAISQVVSPADAVIQWMPNAAVKAADPNMMVFLGHYWIIDQACSSWYRLVVARMARAVAPGIPHHVTRQGNRRQQTFFMDDDDRTYLELMSSWCGKGADQVSGGVDSGGSQAS